MGSSDTFRRTFLRSAGAAGGALALTGRGSAQEQTDGYELLVGVSSAADMNEIEADVPSEADVVHRNEALRYMTVAMPEDTSWSTRIAVESEIADSDGVRYVEENAELEAFEVARGEVEAAVEPDDPRFADQYYPEQVNAPEAWETTLGSDDVTIGIVDTGVDYEHPDLRDRFPDDPGRDFVDDDDDPIPEDGVIFEENHGTHVAGLAAATTGNGEGVAGVSNSTLISARALGTRGAGSIDGIADAVQYVTDRGADVINMSLGGGGPSDTLRNAISYAQDNDALVVAAAGNSGQEEKQYPASFEGVVAVSAVDDDENLADFSTFGEQIDVTAPGVSVLSTWPQDSEQYSRISGTSMSSPVAAGVAALGLAAYPDLSATELQSRLKETARDVGLSEKEQGAGHVDAAAIVEGGSGGGSGGDGGSGGGDGDGGAPIPEMIVGSRDVRVGEPVEFDGSLSFDLEGVVEEYRWEFGDGATASGPTVEHSYDEPGEYTVTLTVTDGSGVSADSSATITVAGDGGGGGDEGVVETTETGSIDGPGGTATYTYEVRSDDPSALTVSLSGPSGADFDLYLTHDGSTPTTTNYDQRAWTFGASERIEVAADALSPDAEIGVTVYGYSGSGQYTLTISERGAGAGDGDGGTGDGDDGGDDDDGTLPGGDPGADCGGPRATESMSGTLETSFGEATFVYETQLDEPCQISISLSGPADADFDLFASDDGTVPGSYDYDHAATTPDSNEQVTVEGDAADGAVGIMVQSWSGTGAFELQVEELGRES